MRSRFLPSLILSAVAIAALALAACRGGADRPQAVDPGPRRDAVDDAKGEEGGGRGIAEGRRRTADTTGLGVPGADSIRHKAPGADRLLALASRSPSMGPDDATVVIVEFSDFECPFCARAHETVRRLMRNRAQARLIYMQFPIAEIHPGAMLVAEASLEAQRQGKFWQYHDALFEHDPPFGRDALLRIAEEQGLDAGAMRRALDEHVHRPQVLREIGIGRDLGVTATPTFFINGYMLIGAQPYERFVTAYNVLLRASRRADLAEAAAGP